MEGVQEGDPLGPILFGLSIYQIQSWLQSELWLLYLDDITTGGSLEQIQHDLQVIVEDSQDLCLTLSHQKSETVYTDPITCTSLTLVIPDAKIVAPTAAVLAPRVFYRRHNPKLLYIVRRLSY